MMNIVVVGQGAIGLLWYAYLTKNKVNTYLQTSDSFSTKQHSVTLQKRNQESEELPLHLASKSHLAKADIVLFCTKSYQVSSAIEQYIPHLSQNALILLCHNGMLSKQRILTMVGSRKVALMLTTHGCKKHDTLSIEHTGEGDSHIGFISDHAHHLLTDLPMQEALPEVIVDENINQRQWLKLAVNCVINPLTAIHNIENGDIGNQAYQQTIDKVLSEVAAVAKSLGVVLDQNQLIQSALMVAKKTARNSSSMRSDILNKRKTEIAQINGFIVEQGQALNIATPENKHLVDQVNALTYDKP